MINGYFRLVNKSGFFGVAVYPPSGGGAKVQIGEIEDYLDGLGIPCDRRTLGAVIDGNKEEVVVLGNGQCPEIPETYQLSVNDDGMTANVRFIPASETGKRLTREGFLRDLSFRRIVYGVDEEMLNRHFSGNGIYCTDIVIARGENPVQGTDARIEYMFDTEIQMHPQTKEDGSVDYFNMTTISQCKKGEVLARIIPEDPGVDGSDIYGNTIKPRTVKKENLRYGRNIQLSEDRLSISAEVDGHVSLIDGKVFVSNVYEVKNVDVSTGNLEFEGSIEIGGDVKENFKVEAGGDVVINGTVEGATIIAGGNIIIAKGMNGMGKGVLRACGNVVVKFLENATVTAGGYIQTEAVLHSQIVAGTEVLVDGRRGMIVGGHVRARNKVDAKTIGALMGGNTILELGVDQRVRERCSEIQRTIAENGKTIQNGENVLKNFQIKLKQGVQLSPGQVNFAKTVAQMLKDKNEENQNLNQELEQLRQTMLPDGQTEVIVRGEVFPGTTIIMGEAVRTIQTEFRYCRFIRERGEISMSPI